MVTSRRYTIDTLTNPRSLFDSSGGSVSLSSVANSAQSVEPKSADDSLIHIKILISDINELLDDFTDVSTGNCVQGIGLQDALNVSNDVIETIDSYLEYYKDSKKTTSVEAESLETQTSHNDHYTVRVLEHKESFIEAFHTSEDVIDSYIEHFAAEEESDEPTVSEEDGTDYEDNTDADSCLIFNRRMTGGPLFI